MPVKKTTVKKSSPKRPTKNPRTSKAIAEKGRARDIANAKAARARDKIIQDNKRKEAAKKAVAKKANDIAKKSNHRRPVGNPKVKPYNPNPTHTARKYEAKLKADKKKKETDKMYKTPLKKLMNPKKR